MKIDDDGNIIITEVTLSVDDLYLNNTPNINFWVYCIMNDYVKRDENDANKFNSTVDIVWIIPSKDVTKNDYILEMLNKCGIAAFENKSKKERK